MALIELNYFAWVRERMGKSGETVALPASVRTVRDLIGWLAGRDAAGAAAFAEPDRIRAALGGGMVSLDDELRDHSDVSLFPPVTGG